jgi:putative MATE family efflux protein
MMKEAGSLPSYRKIWAISYPLILSMLAQNIINVIDTAFLGRVGEVELGAAAIGGLFYFILYMVGFGFSIGAQILIARRNGEKNYPAIGVVMTQGSYFLILFSILTVSFMYLFSHELLGTMVNSPNVLDASHQYLDYRIYGMFFAMLNVILRSFYVGIANTRILLINALIMAVVNIILDYAMIFGHLGFPAMGIAGAAIASVVSEAIASIYLLLLTLTNSAYWKYRLFSSLRPNPGVIRSLMGISVFIMVQFFISMSAWFAFFMIIEKMGERQLAVSNIIRSAYMILMIPVFGFGSTANTLVSNAIGEKRTDHVMGIIFKIARLSVVVMTGVALLTLVIPRLILMLYTSDPILIDAGLPSLYVISGALVVLAFASILFNGISGTANTNVAMYIEMITLSMYLFFAWLFAIHLTLPVEVVWTCEYIYFIFFGGLSWVYLRSGRWKHKAV